MAIQDVLAKQLEFDQALPTQLSAGGDNASVVHKVEHHFVAAERCPGLQGLAGVLGQLT